MPTPALRHGKLTLASSTAIIPGRFGGRHIQPVADDHQARVNVGVAEDRRPAIGRTTRDLSSTPPAVAGAPRLPSINWTGKRLKPFHWVGAPSLSDRREMTQDRSEQGDTS